MFSKKKECTASSNSEISSDYETEEHENDTGFGVEFTSVENISLDTPYPVYGAITNILDENDKGFVVELNYNIKAHLNILSGQETIEEATEKKEVIRKKSFECGIFVLEFFHIDRNFEQNTTENFYPFEATCRTVIFGKSPEAEVH